MASSSSAARIAAIGFAFGEQLLGDRPVTLGAGELIDGLAVPIEPEPAQAVEDRGIAASVERAAVGVLDAEQELAAGVARA